MEKHNQKDPLDFLQASLEDKALGRKIYEAIEHGSLLTARKVMEIAASEGYSFSQAEFQEAILRQYREKFEAGDTSFAVFFGPNAPADPPESSCQKGCISWTYNHSWINSLIHVLMTYCRNIRFCADT